MKGFKNGISSNSSNYSVFANKILERLTKKTPNSTLRIGVIQ